MERFEYKSNLDVKGLTLGTLAGVGAGELVSCALGVALGVDLPLGAELAVDTAGALGLGAYGFNLGRKAVADQHVADWSTFVLIADPETRKKHEEFSSQPIERIDEIARQVGRPPRPRDFLEAFRQRPSPNEGHER